MYRWLSVVGLIACLTFGLVWGAYAQMTTTLSGYVTDATTGKPMPFANVYLNGSTRGSITNEQGHFSLVGVPLGTVEVVASFVGYQPANQTLRLNDEQAKTINFRLKPGGQLLATVTVRGNLKKWERHLRQFKKQLLGEPFGGQCEIINPDVLSFTEENGHLKAVATEPLVIENHALGYKLWYELAYFDGTFQKVFYAGSTRFEELKAPDERQANRYRRNRMRAYLGSVRHLMVTLIDSTYEQEGFLVYQEDITIPIARGKDNRGTLYGSIRGHLKPLSIKKLIQPGRLPFERRLVSDRQLVVFYTNAMSPYSPYSDARYAYSQIKLPAGQMQMTTDGVITLPYGSEIQGSLADDRLSTMLPADWKPDQDKIVPSTNVPIIAQGKLLPPDARMERIVTAFKERFHALAPVLFVHTDKPFYATGDRIWLSAYLLDAVTNRRPVGETAIHVALRTASGRLVQHQWLKISEGRAAGDFRLSDSLASGTYQLRAYTDEDDGQHRPAFERSIAVYNLVQSQNQTIVDSVQKPLDVQLLPEGGHWVVGVRSLFGIKVVASDGLGRQVAGRILDDAGVEMARFTTNPLGLGSVVLAPVQGHTYQAQVTALQLEANHRLTGSVQLPPAEADGLLLSADVVSDSSRLIIMITGTNRPAVDSAYVLIQQQGRVVDQRKIQLQNGVARVSLPIAALPPGLNQLTLYDASARPKAERLVFLPERLSAVRVLMSLNKARYQPREQAILSVTLNDDGLPAVAVLSASVTDAGQVPDDTAAATIQTHLLLTGELRGRVEQPNLYLKDNSPETRRALDDLLLTQGWRRVSGTPDNELLGGVSLIGRVLNQKNEPIPGAQVMIASMATEKSFLKSAGADEKGWFRLAGLDIADTMQVLAQLTNRELKPFLNDEAHFVLSGPGRTWDVDTARMPSNWQALHMQIAAAKIRQEDDAAFYRDKTVKLLKEVIVRARKIEERPDDIKRRSLHSNADATLVFDEKSPRFPNLYEMIRGRFAGVSVAQSFSTGGYQVVVRGVGSIMSGSQPLFLMDGMPVQDTDGTALLNFNPGDIERVELLKNAGTAGIYGVRGGNGVIAFYSKVFRPDNSSTSKKTGTKPMQLIGYPSVLREFYVPRYDSKPDETTPSEISSRFDRRDVLYWKPLIQTDGQGHSQLQFPLLDVVRTLRVTVQGITAEGRPVVGSALIRVQ
jgi:hypothetical protein